MRYSASEKFEIIELVEQSSQGRARAIHPRPDGDARPLCAARRTVVC
jgi:hypothetical protein